MQLDVSNSKNELLFEARFLPNELAVFQEIYNQSNVSRKQLKELYKRLDTYEVYTVKVSKSGEKDILIALSEDKADYQNKQFYLIESIQTDFALVRDGDTLSPINCQFENNYGAAPFVTLHLTFEKATTKKINSRTLLYNDQLFGSGLIAFDYSFIKNLQIPKIK